MRPSTLADLYQTYKLKNTGNLLADFRKAIWALNAVNHALFDAKTPIKQWQQHLEPLVLKFSLACSSLAELGKGTKTPTHRKGSEIIYPDLASIYLLGRSLIEGYLTIYYLNFQVKEKDHAMFRFWLYEYNGLWRRQQLKLNFEEFQVKKDEEKEQMSELREQLEKNSYYAGFDDKRKKTILKEPREVDWTTLIKQRGIRTEEFENTWRMFSNYAHSEYWGVLQIVEYLKNKRELDTAVHTIIQQVVLLLVLLIFDHTDHFFSSRIMYNTFDSDLRTRLEYWHDMLKK